MSLNQNKSLLDEVMELIDPSQGVDADNGEELFATLGKMGRGEAQLLHQSVDPLKAGIVEVVQSHEHEQELLLGCTEGVVEDQQIVALGQHLLLDAGAEG